MDEVGSISFSSGGIITLIISAVVAYFFFKPYLKNEKYRKFIVNGFLILFPFAILASKLGEYLMEMGQPESFNRGVELISGDPEIINRIGKIESLNWNEKDLPKETDNPAVIKFSIDGSKAKIYLKAKMVKGEKDKWLIAEIQKDSIIEEYK